MKIRLSQYAKNNAVTYRTAWNWFKRGLIPNATKLLSGSIVVEIEDEVKNLESNESIHVALYARTSSSKNKKMLQNQLERLEAYASSKGYIISKSVKEFGSGLNDQRTGLSSILKEIHKYDKIIVEHRDRLTRFGFNWFQLFANDKIEVINEVKTVESEITEDLIAIIHSFAARMYGLRKKKRKILEVISN